MRTAFTKALYYPFIDIQDGSWLKNALLFWDSILTIVPNSLNNPYVNYDTEYLSDIGFLQPYYVTPEHDVVKSVEKEMIKVIKSNRSYKTGKINLSDYNEKMETFSIYSEKMPYRLQNLLRSYQHGGEFHIESALAYRYMQTLANRICEEESIALVTNDSISADFTKRKTINSSLSKQPRTREISGNIEQGILLDLIVEDLHISSDTPLDDIVRFKDRHRDEFGIFRAQLAKLTQGVSSDNSIKVMKQEIKDIYENEFLPSYNNFKAALKSSRIKLICDKSVKISFLSISATSVSTALFGMPIKEALLAGTGITLLASTVSYHINRKQHLRENPYSYLLYAQKEF